MLTQLEVFTPGITDPPLPIVDQDVALDSMQIKKITGLQPVTANVNTKDYGSIDGSFLTGTATQKRNIVLTVGLNPDFSQGESFESLRQVLYSYFMPETEVRLRFSSTHMATVEITGVVESCELDMFTKDPEYQISILCPQPFFTAVSATVYSGVTQDFTAPVDVALDYEGSVPAGFIVDITLPTSGTPFTGEARVISHTPDTKIAIISPVTVSSSTFFRLSGVQGNKFIQQVAVADGSATDILPSLAAGSKWIMLRKGSNNVQILTATAGLNWTLSYYARYGGL